MPHPIDAEYDEAIMPDGFPVEAIRVNIPMTQVADLLIELSGMPIDLRTPLANEFRTALYDGYSRRINAEAEAALPLAIAPEASPDEADVQRYAFIAGYRYAKGLTTNA